MAKVLLSLLIVVGSLSAQTFTPGSEARALPAPGIAKTFLLPGDELLPQIANGELGGGQIFFTIFEAVSISDGPASFEVKFFDGAGIPMMLPVMQGGVTVETGMIGDAIAPGGVRFAQTVPDAAEVKIGYATVESVPEGAIVVTARFSNRVPGERLFQASVPVTTRLHDRFRMPFINTGGFVASIAIVSLVEQTVTFRVRSSSGTELCMGTAEFAAGQHLANLLTNLVPCAADMTALFEVDGEMVGLSGVGFTAADEGQGAFVTVPVYGAVPN